MAARYRGASNQDIPLPSIHMPPFKIDDDLTDPFLRIQDRNCQKICNGFCLEETSHNPHQQFLWKFNKAHVCSGMTLISSKGAQIAVGDGALTIVAKNQERMQNAIEKIDFLVGLELEEGRIYKGIVSAIKEYGAFIEFNSGQHGLLHIYELSHELVHCRTHRSNSQEENKPSHPIEVVSEPQRQNIGGRPSSENLNMIVDSDRIASNSEASCRDSQAQHGLSSDHRCPILPNIGSFKEADTQLHNHQDLGPKVVPKGMKGGYMLAITTFGYQILRCPQFSELWWVTSKLKEGPSTDVNGPWKRWPFNSCVTYRGSSLGKVVDGVVCANLKDKEHTSLVRGLIVVGLLAYRGVYTSVREVSSEVRMVLELLVEHIQDKILCRKDRYHRYFQLLSQVAYLEDLATTGHTHIRGEDFNQRIMECFIKLIKKYRKDISKDNRALGKLRRDINKDKHVALRALDEQPCHKERSRRPILPEKPTLV